MKAEDEFRESVECLEWKALLHFVTQPALLGVGDAILRAGDRVEGTFAVVMGDGYYFASLEPAVLEFERFGADGGLLVEELAGAPIDAVGWARLDGREIVEVCKTADPSDARVRLTGMALLPEEVFSLEPPAPSSVTGELKLEQLVTGLLQRGPRFRALPFTGWTRNVNLPDDVDQVRERVRADLANQSARSEAPDARSGSVS